jgi:flavin reductase (DIM6/NTAB) family NADH-FMN oxidoreductase RutF
MPGGFMEVSAQSFKQTLSRFASGVTVVTMQDGDTLHGITVSAFLSVSLEPPLVLVSIDKKAHSQARLLTAERFGVSILAQDQEYLSNHFAGRDESVQPTYDTLAGFPVLNEALAQLVCQVHQVIDVGDHTLFIGYIQEVAWREAMPLTYFQGKYRRFSE